MGFKRSLWQQRTHKKRRVAQRKRLATQRARWTRHLESENRILREAIGACGGKCMEAALLLDRDVDGCSARRGEEM